MSNKFEKQTETRTPAQTLEGLSAEVRGKLEQVVNEYFDLHPDTKLRLVLRLMKS